MFLYTSPKSIIILDERIADITKAVLPFAYPDEGAYLSVMLRDTADARKTENLCDVIFCYRYFLLHFPSILPLRRRISEPLPLILPLRTQSRVRERILQMQ